MPIYEFDCKECGKRSEFLLEMGKTKKKCPECGKLALERVISNPTYHDTYSPMNPRRGRGVGGYGRVDPGIGACNIGRRI